MRAAASHRGGRTDVQAPTTVRAVILDVDGTLVDSNDAHARAWVRALKEGGHDVPYERVRPLMGMGGDKVIPLLTGLNPHEAAGELIADRRRRFFAADYLPLLNPQPGAHSLLLMLREQGIRRVVASSAEEGELGALLHVAGADDLVEHAVSKDEAGRSKPDPDAVHAALAHLGLSADEVVMIGDTPYDIEAAGRLNVATIAFRCGGWSSQDLADALAVYDDPQDLLDDYDASVFAPRAGLRRVG
jgi:HAD superfamily hydrolase (TIGR01509 family)